MAKWCLPSVSQIQISLTLFNVYTVQHAHFQTTPRISQLYSCMHGFQTTWSLIQIFEFYFTLIMTCMHGFQTTWSLIQIFEFYFTLIMTPPILLHPHSSLLFIIVPLTFSRACMHIIIYPTSPSHHPCLPLHLSDACTMAKRGGSKGPAPPNITIYRG